MADLWYLIRAGEKVGPLSVGDLRSKAAAGEIVSTDLLWKQGMEQPVACGRVRGLLPTASPVSVQSPVVPGGPATPPPLGEIGGGVVPGSRFCTHCGKPLIAGDGFCTACGARGPVAEKAITVEDRAIGLVIPHKVSGLAVVAGYVGLVSLCALIPSPIAILLGILAIRDLRKHPDKQGYGRAIFAIVAGILALLAGLMLILLPLLAR